VDVFLGLYKRPRNLFQSVIAHNCLLKLVVLVSDFPIQKSNVFRFILQKF